MQESMWKAFQLKEKDPKAYRKKKAEEARDRKNKRMRKLRAEKRFTGMPSGERRRLLNEWEQWDDERSRMKKALDRDTFKSWLAGKRAERRRQDLRDKSEKVWNAKWGEEIKKMEEAEEETKRKNEDHRLGKIAAVYTKRQYERLVRLVLDGCVNCEARTAKLALLRAKYVGETGPALQMLERRVPRFEGNRHLRRKVFVEETVPLVQTRLELARGLVPVNAPGVYGEEGYKFVVDDILCKYVVDNMEEMYNVVDAFEQHGRVADGTSGRKIAIVGSFKEQCAKRPALDTLRRREARSGGSTVGFTAGSCGKNTIQKPAFLLTGRRGEPKRTNYPIPYACAEGCRASNCTAEKCPHRRGIEQLLEADFMVQLLAHLQCVAERVHPGLTKFLIDLVPKQLRLSPGLVWNQSAATGGSYSGQCNPHTDRHNLLSGFFQLAGDNNVTGGDTVIFQKEDKRKQLLAIKLRRGRCIFGPFHCVTHAATSYEGGRAVIGAYVDRRIVNFCTVYRMKANQPPGGLPAWEEREADDWRQQVATLRRLWPYW